MRDTAILLCLTALFLLSSALVFAGQKPESQDAGRELDLAQVRIESEAARKLLGTEYISVRKRHTDYMPEGELPVVTVKVFTDEDARESLRKLALLGPAKEIGSNEIETMGNIYAVRRETASYWVSRSSGAYKFTEAADSMGRKSELHDFKEAVQRALEYIAEHRLITLSEGEEADILFVSAVRNALTTVKEKEVEEKPLEEFISDYYVGFGRRFRSVPVWGSRLVIRVDGRGKVASVFKNWRSFSGYGPAGKVGDRNSLQKLIISDPAFSQQYGRQVSSAEEVHIVDRKCGYIEAPVNYRQAELRIGCIVSFRTGEAGDEASPQIIVPLEEGLPPERLMGTRAAEGGRDEK